MSTFRTTLLLLQQGRITEFLRSTDGKNPQQQRASGVFSPSTNARPPHPWSLEVCRE